MQIQLKEGTSVYTPGGEEVGRINRFVMDPATNEVTHIVIQKGWLLPEDKLVPFHMVRSATDDRVVLNEEIENFDDLAPFEETHFVRATDDLTDSSTVRDPAYQYTPAFYWYPAQSNIGFPGVGLGHFTWPGTPGTETRQNIPEDTIALKEGTDVISSDGEHVGNVERLIVDSESNKATHFLISQGLLFKDRKLVPLHWVTSVEEDKVHLAVPARLLERLPAYEE